MTVRIYSSLDTGAPALSGDFYARLRTILKACLVDGYGSKPGAGWSVSHDVPGGFSLSNGDGVINFVNQAVYDVRVYIMEAVTDGTTALAGGVNRRSAGWYDGSAVTERGNLYQAYLSVGSNPHWVVVADDKTCYWGASGNITTADQPTTGNSISHYFGNYINSVGLTGPAAFCSLGGGNSAGAGTQRLVAPDSRYGMLLRNPFTGLAEQGATPRYGISSPAHSRGSGAWQIRTMPSFKLSRIQYVRASLMCYGAGLNGTTDAAAAAHCGHLRGLVSEPLYSCLKFSELLAFLSLSNVWQARVRTITLPNGVEWLPILNEGDGGVMASLNPADWE